MSTILRKQAIILLYFVGLTALLGGWGLMNDPTGQALHLSLNYLAGTPFQDYFYPGLILFVANGISSLVIAFLTVKKWEHYGLAIFLQGAILSGWIIFQMMLIKESNWMHMVYILSGTFLLISGILLYTKLPGHIKQNPENREFT